MNTRYQHQSRTVPIGRVIRALSLCSYIEDTVDHTDHTIQEFLDALKSPMRPENASLLERPIKKMIEEIGEEDDYYPSTDTIALANTFLTRFSIVDYGNRDLRPKDNED